MAPEADTRTQETLAREGSRLRAFIRRRVPDPSDAEDLLQDVWQELVEANRMLVPIEHVTGWLYQVARHRIVDLFRRRRPGPLPAQPAEGDPRLGLEELLPDPGAGPAARHLRRLLIEEIESAVSALPREQREVFVAHEIEGRSFKELAAESGLNLNTLLSRKHAAVTRLRERLSEVYEAFVMQEGEDRS